MNFNNYYLWPKKFLDDATKEKNKDLKPFVDNYVEEIINRKLVGLSEEELESLISELSHITSFYSRLRNGIIRYVGGIALSRMMDEADFEAEFESELKIIMEEE
tara:strand:- start:360 stop:671 length:312 start_codon:yes stop_codon:yes gene_type:complete